MGGLPPLSKLRRLALDSQGLLKQAPFGLGSSGTLKAIEHLGYVQIDTISVVARAHGHVLRTRVPDYREAHLDALQRQGRVFEYWYHAAAYLPMRDYRFALPHMLAMRRGEAAWQRCRDRALMGSVLERVRSEGPLKARDFEDARARRAWWDHKPAKRALEQLFMEGELMVAGRDGFQKVYDLTERVLPPDTDTRPPEVSELARHLVATTLRSHGVVSRKQITYLRPGPALRQAVKACLDEDCARGALTRFTVNGETLYTDPVLLERRAPTAPARVRVLSPFDNAVIQRARSQTLFDFDYQIECYLPEPRRRYGYFCLPLLYRDRFVGRADCKAHRREGRLELRSVHLEARFLASESDREAFPGAFAAAMEAFARFNGCESIDLGVVHPVGWRTALHAALTGASGSGHEAPPA